MTKQIAPADPRAEAQGLRDRIAENGRQIERLEKERESAARESVTAAGEPKKKAARRAQKITAEIADLQTEAAGLRSLLSDAEEAIRQQEAQAAAVDAKDHQAQVQSAIDAALSAIDRAHGLFAAGATATDAAIGAIEYCWYFDRFHAGVLTDRIHGRLCVGHLKATCQAQTDFVIELPAASLTPAHRDTHAIDGTLDKASKDARQAGDKAEDTAASAGVELALAIGEARGRIRAVSEFEPGFDVGPLNEKLSAGLKWNVLQAAGFKRRAPSTMPGLEIRFTLCSAVPKEQPDSELAAARKAYSQVEMARARAHRELKKANDRLQQFPAAALQKLTAK